MDLAGLGTDETLRNSIRRGRHGSTKLPTVARPIRVSDDLVNPILASGIQLGNALRHGGQREAKQLVATTKAAAKKGGAIGVAISCVRGVVNK
jgi:hypothetical protein